MMEFSAIGLGALHFGAFVDDKSAASLVQQAVELGINCVDTAPLYGNGESESILGKIQGDFYVATKVGIREAKRSDGLFGVEIEPLTEANIRASVERSLKRLRREAIDLLMLHAFDSQTPLEKSLSTLDQLRQEGKIRYFGCSNYNPQQMHKLLQALRAWPHLKLYGAQAHFNMIERRVLHPLLPLLESHNVRLIVNRALARGTLSGKYLANTSFPKGSRGAKSPRIKRWLTEERRSLLDSLQQLCLERGVSLPTLSLAWIKQVAPRAMTLIGVRTKEQLVECVKAHQMHLDSTLLQQVDALMKKIGYRSQFYPPRYFET